MAAEKEFEQALALWQGDLLPALSRIAWLDPERARFRERRRRLALAAARLAFRGGASERAEARLEELIREDPLDEEAHRWLFRALARRGERAAIERRLAVLTRRIRRELDTSPSPETIEVARELLSGTRAR